MITVECNLIKIFHSGALYPKHSCPTRLIFVKKRKELFNAILRQYKRFIYTYFGQKPAVKYTGRKIRRLQIGKGGRNGFAGCAMAAFREGQLKIANPITFEALNEKWRTPRGACSDNTPPRRLILSTQKKGILSHCGSQQRHQITIFSTFFLHFLVLSNLSSNPFI